MNDHKTLQVVMLKGRETKTKPTRDLSSKSPTNQLKS